MVSGAIPLPAESFGFIDGGPICDSVTKRLEQCCRIVCKDGHNCLADPPAKAILESLNACKFYEHEVKGHSGARSNYLRERIIAHVQH